MSPSKMRILDWLHYIGLAFSLLNRAHETLDPNAFSLPAELDTALTNKKSPPSSCQSLLDTDGFNIKFEAKVTQSLR